MCYVLCAMRYASDYKITSRCTPLIIITIYVLCLNFAKYCRSGHFTSRIIYHLPGDGSEMLDIGEYMGLEYIKGLIRGGESAWLLFQLTLETKIREILVPRKCYIIVWSAIWD